MFFRLYLDGSADKAEFCVVPVLRLKQIYDSSAAFRDQRGDSSLPPEITEVGRKTTSDPLICPKIALSYGIQMRTQGDDTQIGRKVNRIQTSTDHLTPCHRGISKFYDFPNFHPWSSSGGSGDQTLVTEK